MLAAVAKRTPICIAGRRAVSVWSKVPAGPPDPILGTSILIGLFFSRTENLTCFLHRELTSCNRNYWHCVRTSDLQGAAALCNGTQGPKGARKFRQSKESPIGFPLRTSPCLLGLPEEGQQEPGEASSCMRRAVASCSSTSLLSASCNSWLCWILESKEDWNARFQRHQQ